MQSLPTNVSPPPDPLDHSEVARWLQRLIGSDDLSRGLLSTCPDLRQFRGLTPALIQRKYALPREACRRLWAALGLMDALCDPGRHTGRYVRSPEAAADVLRGLRLHRAERFWVMALSPECALLSVREIGRGSPARCPVSPRMVFQFLMDVGAHRGILAHNHPNGSCLPSEEDVGLTRRLKRLGKQLELPISDHIILAHDGFFSFEKEGLLFGGGR